MNHTLIIILMVTGLLFGIAIPIVSATEPGPILPAPLMSLAGDRMMPDLGQAGPSPAVAQVRSIPVPGSLTPGSTVGRISAPVPGSPIVSRPDPDNEIPGVNEEEVWQTAGIHIESSGITTRVSVDSAGSQVSGSSDQPYISTDGRNVTFLSDASNLVSGDTNGRRDVFVYDRSMGTTTRVSVDSDGNQGNNDCTDRPSISSDGRYVAFCSYASNLVAGDSNSALDIFVHDRFSHTTTRVSVGTGGSQGALFSRNPSISSDGRYVTFGSDSPLVEGDENGENDVFVHDCTSHTTTMVSKGSNIYPWYEGSVFPTISSDGKCVAFASNASNLVSGDTNGLADFFVYNRISGITTLVSVDSAGNQGNGLPGDLPSLSSDGRYVAYASRSTNLVSGDTNGKDDVFVHDHTSGNTTRVSVDSDGNQGNGYSGHPSISSDGRYVAFYSSSTNLVSGDTNGYDDIFLHDRLSHNTTRISIDSAGNQPDGGNSYYPSLSSDGRFVAYNSKATNLVSGDTNGKEDVFVFDRGTTAPAPTITSINPKTCPNTANKAVTIVGTNFNNGVKVQIKKGTTVKGAIIQSRTSNKITCTLLTKGAPVGTYNLIVTNNDGTKATKTGAFTITNPAPVITKITPNTGPRTKNMAVTITGKNFRPGATVKISKGAVTKNAAGVKRISGAKITATLPVKNLAPGWWRLTVRNTDGTSGVKASGFLVKARADGQNIAETPTGPVSSPARQVVLHPGVISQETMPRHTGPAPIIAPPPVLA